MLLCARVFILKQLAQYLPVNTDVMVARRRWVLAQVLPPRLNREDHDVSVRVLRVLWHADTEIMLKAICPTLRDLMTNRQDLFTVGGATPLFVIIDEAQVAADHLNDFFRDRSASRSS